MKNPGTARSFKLVHMSLLAGTERNASQRKISIKIVQIFQSCSVASVPFPCPCVDRAGLAVIDMIRHRSSNVPSGGGAVPGGASAEVLSCRFQQSAVSAHFTQHHPGMFGSCQGSTRFQKGFHPSMPAAVNSGHALTHPAGFRHNVVRVGTSGRAVDPERGTKIQGIQKEYKINPGFTNAFLSLAKLKPGLLAHVTASVEPQSS